LGHTPELRPRLHVHLVELVEQDEALLVRAPDQDIEVLERGRDRYTLLHRDVVVDDELVLWIVGGVEREDILHLLALRQRCQERIRHLPEALVIRRTRLGLVERAERNSSRRAEPRDRGGLEELQL